MSWLAEPASPPAAPAATGDTVELAAPARRRDDRWVAAAITLLLTAGLCAVTAVAGGGTRLGPTTTTEIGILLVSAAVIAAAIVAAPAGGRLTGIVPVAAFVVLTALVALSITWAVEPSSAWVDLNRHLAYLAAFAAAMAFAHLAGTRGPEVLGAITLSAVLISAYALLTKVLPDLLNPDEIYARLREPYGYWNAVGIAAALGLPGLLWLGARRTGHAAFNALGAPGVTICVTTILLAYSRGALLAAVIGLGFWFATVPLRLRGAAVLLLGGLSGAILSLWAFREHGLSDDRVELAARQSAGYELGVAVAVVLLVVLIASLAVNFAVASRAPGEATRRQAGAALVVALALLPITLAASLALSERGLGGSVSNAWHTLTDTSATLPSNGPDRLTAVGSVRAQYWSEALKTFRDRLVKGAGAEGYATMRRRYRSSEIAVQHAHGFLVQTVADLGLLGLAAALALLATWLACALRATALRPRDRGLPFTPERIVLLTLLAVVVTFGVHSLVDFTWFVPGNALPALVAAGFLAGRGPLRLQAEVPEPLEPRARRGLRDPVRVSAAVGVLCVALVAAWVVVQPKRSADAGQEALEQLARGDVPAARNDVQRARDLNPLSVEPLFELSVVEQRAGENEAARAALEAAVRLQPENPATWLRLAEFELYVLDRPAAALDAIRPALFLDPRDTETIDTFVNARRASQASG